LLNPHKINVTHLTVLYLDGNQLKDISPMKELKNLIKLYLGNNQLSKEQVNVPA